MDLDPARWPDPAGMNDQLHAMGIKTLLSVWPHYAPGTQYYDMLKDKGWLIHNAAGVPDPGGFKDAIGPNIDTTNPEAAKWFWEKIRDRYIKPDHFDTLWLDETEPDIDPAKDFFFVGSGARYYNVYPLFHTASVYEGFRRDFGDSRRVMILGACGLSGCATERNGVLVERRYVDVGHAEAFHSCRAELYGDGYAVLGYGHCRLLLAVTSCEL